MFYFKPAIDDVVDMMDTIVIITGLLRLILIGTIFYLNCRTLMNVCFRSNLCIHNLVSTAVVLANLLYLITWPPFLIYALSPQSWTSSSSSSRNGSWTSNMNEQVFCLSQNYVVNAMGMVLLSLLVVRLADRFRANVLNWPSLGCTRNVLITFLMWILPQLVYDLVSLATNNNCTNNSSAKFTSSKHQVFHFLTEIVRIDKKQLKNVNDFGYSLGFMVCEQELSDVTIAFHTWQYMVLVIPYSMAVIIFNVVISVTRLRHRRRPTIQMDRLSLMATTISNINDDVTNKKRKLQDDAARNQDADMDDELSVISGDQLNEHNCCRRPMAIIDLILYSNMLWHLLGRPLVIMHTLYWPDKNQFGLITDRQHDTAAAATTTTTPTFVDVGSHLMLAVSCCFAPTICGLLDNFRLRRNNRAYGNRLPTTDYDVTIMHVKNKQLLFGNTCQYHV